MLNSKISLEETMKGSELINNNECVSNITPSAGNCRDRFSTLDDFYKTACESIKAKIFEVKEEIARFNIEIQNSPSKMDTILEEVKSGDDTYTFEKESMRSYTVQGKENAIHFLTSCLCPSDFDIKDSKSENGGFCSFGHQCNKCWNEPIIDKELLLETYTEDVSEILDRIILEGLQEAEKKMFNVCDNENIQEL